MSPTPSDGPLVHQLIADSPPLDTNSLYCNLLQCLHFADTSVIAKEKGECLGFLSGYRVPGRQDTLFVWQVVVSRKARGQGLATKMLKSLLGRPSCKGVQKLETTITKQNHASWALFRSIAQWLKAEFTESVLFDSEKHFSGKHDTEYLVEIGPVDVQPIQK